ncbi:GNAT family N-acetyltransferase [Amycolatopsis samaneae]|uniref:GNAT family N-acetyltransferase n=1 Tax=Amycolatopsis samaneae TaxID=664691 RepID=A0ABW5GQ73_9PSEU
MDDVAIRPAEDDELAAVAELRWRRVLENGETPVTTSGEFKRQFLAWARHNASTHHCLVVVRDGVVLGMAWLAVTPRVPIPGALERASGDVQSVYVLPEERDRGLGGRLIAKTLELARKLGVERVTVHSTARAVSAYSRAGFAVSPELLQIRLTRPGAPST